ncbi:MAG: hypothetical protein Aurels2KO_07560 [Aureliella sp.]
MLRMILWCSLCMSCTVAFAQEDSAGEKAADESSALTASSSSTSSNIVQQYLYDGQFAAGETAVLLALDESPDDGELRFGLGVLRFVQAVERLGQALYEYGAVSLNAQGAPFLRLPVQPNDDPSAISYQELGRVLECFAADLRRAEATLAEVKDDNVKLPLRLNRISFQFGTDQDNKTEVIRAMDTRRVNLQASDPDLLIHFDRGDVAWLRAYCHLMMAMVEGYRSIDEKAGFGDRVGQVFPKMEDHVESPQRDWELGLKLVDPPRLRRMRMHMLAVCKLNRETWQYIRAETDDDHEWLPNADQTDQLGLTISKAQIDAWLAMMDEAEKVLDGRVLVPSFLLRYVAPEHKQGLGLSFKKLLDDPPADIFNFKRLRENGIAAKYLEDESDDNVMNLNAMFTAFQMFNGPFGFHRAARMN